MVSDWFHALSDSVSSWNTLAVLLRLLLACVVGAVIGLNREYHNKGAGMKTHVLVCVGSALTMVVGEYVSVRFPEARADMNRIGAQVISGVGFLGVGTIIVTGKNEVRGLTTAAGLWACACIGLVAGVGFLEGALLALALVVATFTVLGRIDSLVRKHARTFELYVEFEGQAAVKEFLKRLHAWDCEFTDFSLSHGEAGSRSVAATVTIRLQQMGRKGAFIDAVQALDCVSFCDEI